MVVVLPAPFTPAIMITNGFAVRTSSGFSSAKINSTSAVLNSACSPAPSVMFLSFAERRKSAISRVVARMPTSAEISAVSSSSNSASSTLAWRAKRSFTSVFSTARVFASPDFNLDNQPPCGASGRRGIAGSFSATAAVFFVPNIENKANPFKSISNHHFKASDFNCRSIINT